MARVVVLLVFLGIGVTFNGAYDLYVQAGASSEPTTISMTELKKGIPPNRNLIVTGGEPVIQDGVHYYESRSGSKEEGSDAWFIPIRNRIPSERRSGTPEILLRITEEGMAVLKSNQTFNADSIHGIRVPHHELKTRVSGFLNQKYGLGAANEMLILEYEKKVTGIWPGLAKIVGGVAFITASILLPSFLKRQKSRSRI
jgi:hypothetical protein